MATILARSLNCGQGPGPTPCGQCRSCRIVAAAWPARADLVEIDAGMHGGVDDMADVVDELIDALVDGEPGPVLAALDRALRSTDDAWNLAVILLRRLRDLIVLATVPASDGLVLASGGNVDALSRQARLLGAAGDENGGRDGRGHAENE